MLVSSPVLGLVVDEAFVVVEAVVADVEDV
jgi:hypothetical protein